MGATVFFSFNAFEGYFPSYAGKSREVVIGTCAFITDNPWRPGLVLLSCRTRRINGMDLG